MKREVNPQETSRAEAFELWMKSTVPMVTLVKDIDVTRIVRLSKRRKLKFNMLLNWCIGVAASQIDEFYTLPIQGKMFRFDTLAIGPVVCNVKGGINSCDIPFCNDLKSFNKDYLELTAHAAQTCRSSYLDDRMMVIGTSAMIQTELSCIVNQYTDQFCNPMVMWGKYRKSWFRYTLPVSFQFHHVQMDGAHGAIFLKILQETVNKIS